MALLPAVVEDDIESFGGTLTEIQEITGRWFAPVQGGTFAAGPTADLIARMRQWGAFGVGQSSWGPTVYGVVTGDDAAVRLAARVREWLGDRGDVYEGPFRAIGARVFGVHVIRSICTPRRRESDGPGTRVAELLIPTVAPAAARIGTMTERS